jgi:hypothetical protein
MASVGHRRTPEQIKSDIASALEPGRARGAASQCSTTQVAAIPASAARIATAA